jgi:hypothetical protein
MENYVMERITKKQLKAIWALTHRTGLNEKDIHVRTKSFFGKKSIRSLTKHEASRMIEHLLHKWDAKEIIPEMIVDQTGGATRAQIALIEMLTAQMGWSQQQLLGLARKMYGVKEFGDLNVSQSSGLIEALKAIKLRRAA